MRRCLIVLCCLFGRWAQAAAADTDPLQVRYPRAESALDARERYPLQLLELALQRSGRRFTLLPSAAQMQQSRSLRQLREGQGLDVAWTVTSIERERELRPIRFPIDRGLLGWRLLLIRSDQQARFAALPDRAALAALRGGQGHDWPDLELLRSNGFRVVGSPGYEGLFEMLERGHIDYFPRSLIEVWDELDRRGGGIALDSTWLLHYPSALYFFVGIGHEELAAAIERGLEAALADGSFAALFERHYADEIGRAQLASRRTIELRNPTLPPAAPLQRSELWFTPEARR